MERSVHQIALRGREDIKLEKETGKMRVRGAANLKTVAGGGSTRGGIFEEDLKEAKAKHQGGMTGSEHCKCEDLEVGAGLA